MDNFDTLDKAEQKRRLTMEFGMILGPLMKLSQRQTPPTRQELVQAFAVLEREAGDFWKHGQAFTNMGGEALGTLSTEIAGICISPFTGFRSRLVDPNVDVAALHNELKDHVAQIQEKFFKLVDMVPLDWQLTLSEGDMPFTFYQRMLDALWPARQKVHYFDRYVKPEFFDLYLSRLDRGLEIKIVTTAGNANYGVKSIEAVSKKARDEFSNYQLIQVMPKDIHDRNLRVDDQVFFLGPSVVDAGAQPTNFGPLTNTTNAIRILDAVISNGSIIHQS